MTRWTHYFLALVGAVGLSAGQTSAQTFTWGNYVGSDGTRHNYPRWTLDATDNTKVNLELSQGTITLPKAIPPNTQGTATKATLKIYKQGAFPGTWEVTPTINFDTTPAAPIVLPNAITQTATWADDNTPKIKIPKGTMVKVEVYITVTAGTNSTTYQTQTTYSQTNPF